MIFKTYIFLYCLLFCAIFVDCETDFSKCGTNELSPDHISINYDTGYWPWMGSLGFWSDGKWNHFCGATLINQFHFITAAHCIENESEVLSRWKIRHGDNNLEKSSDDGRAKDFDIIDIAIHPKYRHTAYYDIAVLRVDKVEFLDYRRPVCLPDPENFKTDQYEERAATLIGWGSKEITGGTSSTLKRTILTIYPYSYCNETHKNVGGETKQKVEKYLPQLFQPNLLCAGYEISEQGSCKGDSGGPLMMYKAPLLQYFQVGLVAGGVSKCGDKYIPSYFTRLDHPEISGFIASPNEYWYSDQPNQNCENLSKLLVLSSPGTIEIIDLDPEARFGRCESYHWLEMPHLPVGVWKATGSLFKKTPIICGEIREEGQEVSCMCQAYHFGSWHFVEEPFKCIINAASAVLTNSRGRDVLIIGGGEVGDSHKESQCHLIDGIKRGNPRRKRSFDWNYMPEPVSGHCYVKINSSVLLSIGGQNESGQEVKSTYFYNVKNNDWAAGPPLNMPRVNLSCGLLNWKNLKTNKIVKIVVAAGGSSSKNNEYLNSVELLYLNVDNSSTDEWVTGPPLPVEVVTAMIDYNNTVIAIGRAKNADDRNHLYELSKPTGEWNIMKTKYGNLLTVSSYENKQLAFLVPEEILEHF